MIKIKFADKSLKKYLLKLKEGNDSQRKLFSNITKAVNKLKENPFCGIQIPKKQIPGYYNVNNLWKINMPENWRLLYSIESEKIIIICIILEWLSHKRYERRFKY
ncbi:type II toxin-antitoxin system RelE/ParE family toxin [Candidatus Woesearchaeota archaeon]|nr:type II toxin-antitoxin system RelE/ParE family toxin [Candidatus Woesearchaeota archaeon]